MSSGRARYSGNACTMTLYSCPNRMKLVAYLPPSIVCRTLITLLVVTPFCAAMSLSKCRRYCGKLASKLVKAFAISGRAFRSVINFPATFSMFLKSPVPVRSSSRSSNPLALP